MLPAAQGTPGPSEYLPPPTQYRLRQTIINPLRFIATRGVADFPDAIYLVNGYPHRGEVEVLDSDSCREIFEQTIEEKLEVGRFVSLKLKKESGGDDQSVSQTGFPGSQKCGTGQLQDELAREALREAFEESEKFTEQCVQAGQGARIKRSEGEIHPDSECVSCPDDTMLETTVRDEFGYGPDEEWSVSRGSDVRGCYQRSNLDPSLTPPSFREALTEREDELAGCYLERLADRSEVSGELAVKLEVEDSTGDVRIGEVEVDGGALKGEFPVRMDIQFHLRQ